jgi:hypothetical protein
LSPGYRLKTKKQYGNGSDNRRSLLLQSTAQSIFMLPSVAGCFHVEAHRFINYLLGISKLTQTQQGKFRTKLLMLAQMRTDRAGAGRFIRQIWAGTASPRRRVSGNNEHFAATVRRTPAFAANQHGAATLLLQPGARVIGQQEMSLKREACSTSLSTGLVTLPPRLCLPLLFPFPPLLPGLIAPSPSQG